MICADTYCGQEFERKRINQLYCSWRCRRRVEKRNYKSKRRQEGIKPVSTQRKVGKMQEKACKLCGTSFLTQLEDKVYCSFQCRQLLRSRNRNPINEPAIKKCNYCNKEFTTKKKNNFYCSSECRQNLYNSFYLNRDLQISRHYKKLPEPHKFKCEECDSKVNVYLFTCRDLENPLETLTRKTICINCRGDL